MPALTPVIQRPVAMPPLPAAGAPVGAPPLPQAPGAVPAGSPLYDAIDRAAYELDQSITNLTNVPPSRAGDQQFTPFRKAAYESNMRAQNLLASQFEAPTTPMAAVQVLRETDSKLEYANWKNVGKDPRTKQFVGHDVSGALNDTLSAVNLLRSLQVAPPLPVDPPVGPGPDPVDPPVGPVPVDPPVAPRLPVEVRQAFQDASQLVAQSAGLLHQVQSQGDPQPNPNRKAAYDANMSAQKTLEPLFARGDEFTAAAREVDKQLELANWKTVGKDPATQQKVGIDIAGALTLTDAATQLLNAVLRGDVPQVEPPQAQNPNGQVPQVEPPQSQNPVPGGQASPGDG